MTHARLVLPLVVLAMLVAAPASAGKKGPKPLKHLQPLVEEMSAAGPLSKDAHKAMRYADRCLVSDKHWERSQHNQVPINQIYEQLSSAVICWQTAEKKLSKVGPSVQTAALWVTARARYIEAFRGYLWGIDAKMSGERGQVCRRLKEATRQAVTANEVSAGLSEKFTGEQSRAFALAAEQMSGQLGQTIATEFKNQKCD